MRTIIRRDFLVNSAKIAVAVSALPLYSFENNKKIAYYIFALE